MKANVDKSRFGIRNQSMLLVAGLAIITALAFAPAMLLPDAESSQDPTTTSAIELGTDFNLVDHKGNPITQVAFEGAPTAVFFGFTHCPEICPTTLYEMSVWLDMLGEEGEAMQGYFVTLDPERDTPDIIASYIESFTDRITGITGDIAEIERVAAAWGVYSKRIPLKDGGYTMDHTASVFLLDAKGTFKGTIGFGEDTQSAIAKMRTIIN